MPMLGAAALVPTRLNMAIVTGLVLALTLAGCTSTPVDVSARTVTLEGGARLIAPAGAFSAGANVAGGVVPTPADAPVVPGAPVAGSVEITTSEQPTAPVIVEIPVPPASYADLRPDGDATVLVLHKSEGKDWEPIAGRLDRTRNIVSVETTSLSLFLALLPSVTDLAAQVGEIIKGYFGGVGFRSSPPACPGEQQVRNAGYSIRSSTSDVLRWCLGIGTGARPELKVVLNRSYPVVAQMGSNMTVLSTSGGTLPVTIAQSATELFGNSNRVTLSPGGTTAIALDLPVGRSVRLTSEFDGFAQALVSLQVAGDLLATMAAKVKFAGATRSAKEVLDLMDKAACITALQDVAADPDDAGRLGTMLEACLDPADYFTGTSKIVVGFLNTVLVTLGAVVAYTWSSGSYLNDQFRGQAKYEIVVQRDASATGPGQGPGQDPVLAVLAPYAETPANAKALEKFLRAGIPGFDPITGSPGEYDRCQAVQVRGADLARGALDALFVLSSGGVCGGDAAWVDYKIRDNKVVATSVVCGDCVGVSPTGPDLGAPYGRRDLSSFTVVATGAGDGWYLVAGTPRS